ncbi:MAG: diguanylate cyclase, partial [Candidatus Thiodiazotropha sp.]
DGAQPIFITISIGVSEVEDSDDDVGELIYRADKALYEAKKRGRNRVVILTKGSFISHLAMVKD